MEVQQNGISKKITLIIVVISIFALFLLVVIGFLLWSPTKQGDTNTPFLILFPHDDTHNMLINQQNKYSLLYPSHTQVSLTHSSCVKLNYESMHNDSSITILMSHEDGNEPCGPTGVGLGNVEVTHKMNIDGKTYIAEGFRDSEKLSSLISQTTFDKDEYNRLYQEELRRIENNKWDEGVFEWLGFSVDKTSIVYLIGATSFDDYVYAIEKTEEILGSFKSSTPLTINFSSIQ